MTEEDAQRWLGQRLDVPRETMERLTDFIVFLSRESEGQNLVAQSTLPHVWARHIVDSAQLLLLAPKSGRWMDLGSGAGFPGLIVAATGVRRISLVEERKKRIDFLARAAEVLGIADLVTLIPSRAQTAPLASYDVISARAVAPLDRLLAIGLRFATPTTRWLLPKGRSAYAELDAAQRTWQGEFRIEPSVTDPEAAIIVAEHVRPREQR